MKDLRNRLATKKAEVRGTGPKRPAAARAERARAASVSRVSDAARGVKTPAAREPAPAPAVRRAKVDEAGAGQRLDNYLMRQLKGVPRSHVYRVIRDGQVRVNGRRGEATLRLGIGDEVRIPPVRTANGTRSAPPVQESELPIVFEDDALLVVDKPAGMAVHGGSGVSFGVIERLRSARRDAPLLELVHRLDRDTSGLLVVAKKRAALVALHRDWREGAIRKRYLALVKGTVPPGTRTVDLALRKYLTREGERRVSVDQEGRASVTVIEAVASSSQASLVRAELLTGRTHQIRVHLAHIGHPILGDDKYGDFALNKAVAKRGLKRMFLHAAELSLRHPVQGGELTLRSALPPDLERISTQLLQEAGAGRLLDAGETV
jgi:23S rRNA pseudouridine955/2504/2580 synthase